MYSDYNYERQNDGTCALVPGESPLDPLEVCRANPNAIEYYKPTGYRRIPLTTCQGGKELQYTSSSFPCPGKQEEYRKARGMSRAGLFFAITLPILVAAGVGWWAWRTYGSKLGRIRLGETAPSFDANSPWLAWPVMGVSAVAAAILAIPVVMMSILRWAKERFSKRGSGSSPFTSRASFGRGRDAGYASVNVDDENDLLGDDSDEDV